MEEMLLIHHQWEVLQCLNNRRVTQEMLQWECKDLQWGILHLWLQAWCSKQGLFIQICKYTWDYREGPIVIGTGVTCFLASIVAEAIVGGEACSVMVHREIIRPFAGGLLLI
eukprot:TRINITY_DN1592_c0_g1_i1.p3 TRINITY_DN1592_c0_g1~~TRINITY_DN1592_c0_g1_i1.p3  ORF type:complete len:112 (-),score=10.28 TRINITY_DN1592_c0_g1_i1:122-457(-)